MFDILLCGFSIMQLNPHLNWICKLAVMAYLNSEMYIWSILYLLLSSFINKQCNLGVGKDSGSHNIQYLFKVKKRWHISCRSWEVCNSCIIAGVLLQLVTQCREMFRVNLWTLWTIWQDAVLQDIIGLSGDSYILERMRKNFWSQSAIHKWAV